MKKIAGMLLLSVGWMATYAQSVTGTLKDATDSTAIEYVSVSLFQLPDTTLSAGVVTDGEGSFSLEAGQGGEFLLLLNFMGYGRVQRTIQIPDDRKLNIGTIYLVPSRKLLDELVVEGNKMATMHKIDRQVYEAADFESSVGGTGADVLRNLPAISVGLHGEISYRGTTGFSLLLNGKPLQTAPEVLLNQLPANSIQRIELITAPSARYDPEGKAGIINIITEKDLPDGWYLQVNTRLGAPSVETYDNSEPHRRYGADVTLNYQKDGWNFSLGTSYLRNDMGGRREGEVYTIRDDTTTFFPSDGERSFNEVNFSGKFTASYRPNKQDYFSLGFYAGERTKDRTADILYYNNRAVFGDQTVYNFQYFNENLRTRRGDFVLGSFDYAHEFANDSRLNASVLYEYTMLGGPTTNLNLGYPNTDIIYQEEYNTNNNPLSGVRGQLDYSWRPTDGSQFQAGYQYRFLDHTGDFIYERRNNATGEFELVPAFSSSVDLQREIHSGYAQYDVSRGKWDYGLGIRLEVMDRDLRLADRTGTLDTLYQYNFVQPYPAANIQYQVSEDFTVKAAYSRRVERTTTFKMNPFPEREHSETLEQGDPELLPEFINLVELGITKTFGRNAVFSTLYFRDVNNLVNRVNTIYNDTILNRIYSNVGQGRAYGLEVGLELNPTDWLSFNGGGNIYNYQINGRFDQRPLESQSWIWAVNTNLTADLPWDSRLQWTMNYISSQNTAQGEDSRFYRPSLTISKQWNDHWSMNIQWMNMNMGLLNSAEKSISTWREGEFFTYTNYVYEVDMFLLNISYTFSQVENRSQFIKSEFGEKEF